MTRLAAIAGWLVVGHAAAAALFWALLHIPESSIWTLALSAATAAALVAIACWVHASAAAAWDRAATPARAALVGLRRAPAALLAAALFALFWWATAEALEWQQRVAGQIDAAFIARTGSPRTGWVHATIFWTVQFVRWSLGLTLSVALLASFVADGPRTLARAEWVRRGLSPRRWLTVTFWFVLLLAIPWQVVYWRPRGLSVALEPWFVAGKLGVLAVAAAIGWALVLRAAADRRPDPGPEPADSAALRAA